MYIYILFLKAYGCDQNCECYTDIVLFSCSVVSDSFVTPWTVVGQALLSKDFSRQEY